MRIPRPVHGGQGMTPGRWLSLPTTWVPGFDPGCQAWQQAPPEEASREQTLSFRVCRRICVLPVLPENTRRKGGKAQPGKLLCYAQVGEEFNGSLGVGKQETLRGDWVNCGTFQKVLEKS